MGISIHTPAKGVTESLHKYIITHKNFNPHSREGSDLVCKHKKKIHSYFNPHSREGSDLPEVVSIGVLAEFQSTLPRRE